MLGAIGVVTHPSRDVSATRAILEDWARAHGVALADGAEGTDLVVAIGGDGTILTALRTAGETPVLGVAHGSVGALAAAQPDALPAALDRIGEGDWQPRGLPVIEARSEDGEVTALNDVVVTRAGAGQISVDALVDDVLYGRWAGDGVVAGTPLGSSAYTIAAGGPLLRPRAEAWVMTPLPHHGGFVPPLVLDAHARLTLVIDPGYGGARAEADGQPARLGTRVELALRHGAARLVELPGMEPFFTSLRRRGIVADSPRVLAREARERER